MENDGSRAVGGIESEAHPSGEQGDHAAERALGIGDQLHGLLLDEIPPLRSGEAAKIPRCAGIELEEEFLRARWHGDGDDRSDEIRIISDSPQRQSPGLLAEVADGAIGMPAMPGAGEIGNQERRGILGCHDLRRGHAKGADEGQRQDDGADCAFLRCRAPLAGSRGGHGAAPVGLWSGGTRESIPVGVRPCRARVPGSTLSSNRAEISTG